MEERQADAILSPTQDVSAVLAVAREWQHIQRQFFTLVQSMFQPRTSGTWRQAFEECLRNATAGQASIWWNPCSLAKIPADVQLYAIQLPSIRYGLLALAPRYLISPILPTIPLDFAQLCAIVLALGEYVTVVQEQLRHVAPRGIGFSEPAITPHEREVLIGLVRGETEAQTADRLSISKATVHTHRRALYQELGVHNRQEAVVHSVATRLIDWLQLPYSDN